MISRALATGPAPLRLISGGAETAPSDEEIIAAVQRGEQRVARHLYDRLFHVVDHTLFRVFGKREVDHDDMVQAVFEQIIMTLGRQTYARACSLKTWAASIASHVGFNALRSRKRERRVLDRGADLEGASSMHISADAENQASARIEIDRVRKHLLAMKPEQAETVFLHDVLDHKLAEIALLMQVSIAAATSRLVRGRRELYRRLDADTKRESRSLVARPAAQLIQR
ncbi:MAG: RNA polymerase sigma factor [Polyangiaceae bacterium]